MQIVSTGLRGLDLVLGGGLRLIDRGEGPSTTFLLRGPPGAGKSVLGAQIAIHVAEELQGDIVYACVEILPPEVHAQIGPDGFRFFGKTDVSIVSAPF